MTQADKKEQTPKPVLRQPQIKFKWIFLASTYEGKLQVLSLVISFLTDSVQSVHSLSVAS